MTHSGYCSDKTQINQQHCVLISWNRAAWICLTVDPSQTPCLLNLVLGIMPALTGSHLLISFAARMSLGRLMGNMFSQQCSPMVKTKEYWSWVSKSVASRWRQVVSPLYSTLLKLRLEKCSVLWFCYGKHLGIPEPFQQRLTRMAMQGAAEQTTLCSLQRGSITNIL